MKIQLVRCMLLGLFSLVDARGTTPPDCDSHTSRYDPLSCWLWKLAIHIPNQAFREEIFKIEINDMVCTNFQLTDIASQDNLSTETADPFIRISVASISAACVGRYASTGLSGAVTALVLSPQDPAMQMSLAFRSNATQYKMATSISTQNCSTDLAVPANQLHFQGSISAALINLFKGTIAGYLSSALSTQLCPLLVIFFDEKGTFLIQQADKYMLDLIANKTDSALVTKTQRRLAYNAINFRRDTPLLVTILELFNHLLDRYLDKGFYIDLMQWLGLADTMDADCGYFFRGINGLVQSITDGRINVRLSKNENVTILIPNYATLTIIFKDIELSGLAGLDRIQLLNPTEGPSLASRVQSQTGFNLSAALDVKITPMEGGTFQGEPLEESFHVYLITSNVTAGATLTTDVDLSKFRQIQVGHIISAIEGDTPVLGCLMNPLQSIQADILSTKLHLLGASFSPDGASGRSLEVGMDDLINNFLQMFLREYSDFVSDAFDGFMQGPGRAALNRAFVNLVEIFRERLSPSPCEPIKQSNNTDYLDFAKYGIFEKINEFLKNPQVLASTNSYLNCLADTLVLQVGSPQSTFANVTWILRNLIIDNFGSLEALSILSPEGDGVRLHNSIGFGSSTYASSIVMHASNVTGIANIALKNEETIASTVALILYDLNKVRPMAFADLMKSGFCLAMPAKDFVFYNVLATMRKVQIVINATLQGLTPDTIAFSFDSAQHPALPAKIESIFSWGVSVSFDFVNSLSTYMMSRSTSICEGDTYYAGKDERELSKSLCKGIFWLIWIFCILNAVFFLIKGEMTSRRRELNHNIHDEDDEQIDALRRPLIESRCEDEHIDTAEPTSLFSTKDISSFARHCFPILIIGTIALLIASNLSVGASVDLATVFPNGETFSMPSLFAFSLGNTIEEMYSGGIWALLALVFVFSGVWPYLKLALILFSWVAPPTLMSETKRGNLLFSLDALGKFSLVDTFVLVLMMVTFRYHLDGGGSALDVYVNPKFGFYSFLLATSLSLVAGHAVLFFHRLTLSRHQSLTAEKESLFQHGFAHGIARKRLSWFSRIVLLILLVAALVLLAVGASRKSFVFEVGGLAGTLLGDDRRKTYSMITLGVAISQSVQDPSTIGIRCLQGIYFFYLIVTPFTCLLALVFLVVLPLTLARQRKLMVLIEVMNAWSAIEVFALSMIVALLEISTFASFIVGDKCDIINILLRENFHDLIGGDDVCFSVSASVNANVLFMVIGALINSFVVSLLLRLSHAAIQERITSEDRLGEIESMLESLADDNESIPLVQRLMKSSLRGILFIDVANERD